MIWHIFKKDFRLLWPLSLAAVLVGVLNAVRTPFDGHFYGSELETLTTYLPDLVLLGIALVAVIVVHQDALSESQEDWLVRPLLRRDLALAKVLFVLLTVNVPLMVIDVLVQVALHFPLSVSVGVAASHALYLVLLVSLPALMIGAVTRSLVDTFAFVIASVIGFVLLMLVATSTARPDVLGHAAPLATWTLPWVLAGLVSIGSAAGIALQYLKRRTLLARSIGLAAVFAALVMSIFIPGAVTFAIQESLRGPPRSDGIKLSLDTANQGDRSDAASSPRYAIGQEYGLGPPPTAAMIAANAAISALSDRQIEKVALPLSISGMHPGDILHADRIDVRLVSTTGKVLYTGPGECTRASEGTGIACSTNHLEVWANSPNVLNTEELNLPLGLYQRIKDEPVRVEITYALTRFVPRPTQMIKAIGGQQAMPELGSCATRVDGDGDEVEMGCLTDVGAPSCIAVVLEDPQTHQRNPALRKCDPQYGPYRRKGGLSDAVNRLQLSIPFHDLSGLAHYPVDTAEIAHARIDVTAYDPVAHFRTGITVPSVRLANWAPAKDQPTALVRK